METPHDDEPLPARRPLRVRIPRQVPHPDGGTIYAEEWRVVQPDEPAYPVVYRKAVALFRADRVPMPYADADNDETRPSP